jgi:LysR family transcriptional repressor of citA
MDLEAVVTFLAAAETENFREAARRRYISQAAVSQQVARLEAELKTPLFERQGRRVRLAAGGREFLPYAERLVKLADEARARLAVAQGRPRLVLGGDWLTAEAVVPWLCRQLLQSGEALDIEVRLADSPDEGWDGAVLCDPPASARLRREWLLADPVALVVAADGGDWDREPPDVDAVLRSTRLMVPAAAAYWPGLAAALADRGMVVPTMAISQLAAIRRLIHEGVGAAFLPRMAVTRDLMEGRLLALDVPWLPPMAVGVYWVTPRDQAPTAAAQRAERLLRRRWPARVTRPESPPPAFRQSP